MRSRFMAMEAGRKANPGDFKAPTGAKPLSKGFTYVLSPYDNAMLARGPQADARHNPSKKGHLPTFSPG